MVSLSGLSLQIFFTGVLILYGLVRAFGARLPLEFGLAWAKTSLMSNVADAARAAAAEARVTESPAEITDA